MTRKFLFFASVFCLCVFVHLGGAVAFAADIEIDETNFPDANFRAYISSADTGFDKNQDGKLTEGEIVDVTSIRVVSKNITSLKGIEYFTALTDLYCYNNQLTTLDISKNTALTNLRCSNNTLTALDVSNNTALTTLSCFTNQLTTLDVKNNTSLINLYCNDNQLTTLDISKNIVLRELHCDENQLTALDINKNTALTSLHCDNNQITVLDIGKNTALTNLNCSDNQLKTLDVSKNTALTSLVCGSNQLSVLDINTNSALIYLICGENQLTALDVSKQISLRQLICYSNKLTTLDVSNNTSLTEFLCNNQKINITPTVTGHNQYPYSISLSELGLDSTTFSERVSDVEAKDSSGNVLTVSMSNGLLDFNGYPSTMTYNYDTKAPASISNSSMDVTVTFAYESTPDYITGISITSPDSKVVNLPASGGTFDNVIVEFGDEFNSPEVAAFRLAGEIIDNPSSGTNIGEVSDLDYYYVMAASINGYIKGRAAPNYSGTKTTTRITFSFDSGDITYSASFDVVVASAALSASGYNTRAWRYQFSMPSQLANTIASIFGVNSSQIFQLTDSEILDENWTLEAGDNSSISNMGETVAINMPSVMPSNTGVYVMRYALDSSLAGKNLKVRGVADSNSNSSVSTSAIEDREYVFFDENYNEITSVPSSGIVYVAQRMTSGQANRGVITTSDELSVGLIKPIEEASRDILREKISELKDVKTEEVLFIEERNIYPAQEPPAIVIEQSKNDNANILAKFNTLSVDISGLYVFHVILSDDVAKEIESVDIDKLRIYAAEFESTDVFPAVYQASDGQVKTAFLYGLLNTFEVLTMSGEKLKFGAKEFLMVGFLNASKPLSLYIGKILLALLMGGCNSGFGVAVLALIVGGFFISQKKKRRSLS